MPAARCFTGWAHADEQGWTQANETRTETSLRHPRGADVRIGKPVGVSRSGTPLPIIALRQSLRAHTTGEPRGGLECLGLRPSPVCRREAMACPCRGPRQPVAAWPAEPSAARRRVAPTPPWRRRAWSSSRCTTESHMTLRDVHGKRRVRLLKLSEGVVIGVPAWRI
jgi:hypothetical protein